ncbi:MAG: stage II sporulation protein M [Anaerolineae bacterium]
MMAAVAQRGISWVRERALGLMETLGPAWVITRREVQDTLRDWRILLPIGLLITIFPFLANYAANAGLEFVNKYGADLIMTRLFPFLMLIMGFFPSSFSLVIALETFVGEKERRSLEPLLATPLTDTQLYLGKLFSCTLTPVIASYIAIIFYMLLVGFSAGWWPTFSLLAVTFVLATAQALVMVGAAVVISSQATSTRAANLVASFIIVPVAFLLQWEASLLLFGQYTALWLIALFLVIADVLFIRMGVRVFHREHLLGRTLDHLDIRGAWQTFWRAFWFSEGLGTWYRRQLPQRLRRLWPELLFTVLVVFVGGTLVGDWASQAFPLPVDLASLPEMEKIGEIEEVVEASGLLPSFSTGAILKNNVRSLLFAALLALFTLGMAAQLLLMIPIIIIAYAFSEITKFGINPWAFLGAFILPHGAFELPAAVIATAQAMRVSVAILRNPEKGGGVMGMLRELGYFFQIFIAFTLPLLTLAAWIEVHLTPHLAIALINNP